MKDIRYFPVDLRGGILRWFSEKSVGPEAIWRRFAQLHGYGTVEDLARSYDARCGAGSEAAFRLRMDEYWLRLRDQTPSAQGANDETLARVRLSKAPMIALHAVTDQDFARVLEVASLQPSAWSCRT